MLRPSYETLQTASSQWCSSVLGVADSKQSSTRHRGPPHHMLLAVAVSLLAGRALADTYLGGVNMDAACAHDYGFGTIAKNDKGGAVDWYCATRRGGYKGQINVDKACYTPYHGGLNAVGEHIYTNPGNGGRIAWCACWKPEWSYTRAR
jgi:hypothetical protein